MDTDKDNKENKNKNDDDVIDKYFDLNLFILRVAGVWIEDDNRSFKSRLLNYLYNAYWLIFCLLLYQPIESGTLFEKWDLLKFVRSLRDQFNHLICFYKLFVWFTNRKLLLSIMRTLQSKKYVYEEFENFKPNEIYKEHKKVSTIWAKIFLCGVNFICLNMCFSILYIFIFKYDSQYAVDDDGTVIYNQKFPGDLLLPYKVTNRTIFFFTFIFQVVALDIYGWMIIGKLNNSHMPLC